MARQTERIPLEQPGPGTRHELTIHRYGTRGARPKAYFQASLHADETPAMMAAHHLLKLLEEADAKGLIRGEIVVVPYANPIGLAQWVNDTQLGRYELRGGGNFNRGYPDLTEPLAALLEGTLGDDAGTNVAAVRAAIPQVLAQIRPRKELDALRLALAREALTADLALDLHCDDDSLMHLFLIPQHWPEAAPLAAELGCHAVMLCEDSGGGSFDEFCSTLWVRLARRFPQHPIPAACLAGTVEFRGQADVSDELGAVDGGALYRFLARRGFVDETPGEAPKALCEATDLAATQSLKAPGYGILAYKVALGERVTKGQTIAELIDPAAPPNAPRRRLLAETDGILLSRRSHKFVSAGQGCGKIVGKEPLPGRSGYLLED